MSSWAIVRHEFFSSLLFWVGFLMEGAWDMFYVLLVCHFAEKHGQMKFFSLVLVFENRTCLM